MYYLEIDWQKLLSPYPQTIFSMLWWSVGIFVALMIVAFVLRLLAKKQKEDRALKLQLRGTGNGLIWWGLGGFILTWLRWEAIPWLGTPIILPIYVLLILIWLLYSWSQFRAHHQQFLQKIKEREDRLRYLPKGGKHKKK